MMVKERLLSCEKRIREHKNRTFWESTVEKCQEIEENGALFIKFSA